jgi:hypothetical protein
MEGGWDYYANGGGTLNAATPYTVQPDGTIKQAINGGNGSYGVYQQGANVGSPWDLYDSQGNYQRTNTMKSDNPMQLFALAALAAGGMGFGLPGLMGSQAGGAGAGISGAAFGDAGLMYGGGIPAVSGGGGGLFSGLGGSLSKLGGSLSSLAGGTGGGGMSFGWGDLLSTGLNLIGANQTAKAAQGALGAAADASKFRPVGITTRFGQSGFQFDDKGNLVGAGYNLDPTLAGMREGLLGAAQGGLGFAQQAQGAGQGLFNLGSQYLAQNPQEVATNWMNKQQSLLAPSRERALSGVRNNLFNTGRSGLAVGATGTRPDGSAGLGAANPEMEAYYNSLAQQDAQLATQADKFAMDQITFGQGLLGGGIDLASAGYNPFKTALGLADSVEGMGSKSLALGAELGGRSSSAGANAAQYLARTGFSPMGGFLTNMANNPALGQWLSGNQDPEAWRTTGNGMPY